MNKVLATCFVGLNVLDAALTRIDWDSLHEMNPLLSALDTQTFWAVKMGAILFSTTILLFLARKYPKHLQKIFTALVICMTCVCIANGIALV